VNIGIICYASVGGSGVVATELAKALSTRGHRVHLMSADAPFRLGEFHVDLSFHQVQTPSYPLFREPQYLLALTNTLVSTARRHKLDIIHAHYAVPHATAAYLADRILGHDSGRPPRTVTTLHGTDITLIGSDPSYKDVVAFSIEGSDGITAVSDSLRRDTVAALGIRNDIRVIPNFLDCSQYRRQEDAELRAKLCPAASCEAVLVHVSNFRPVKRVSLVLELFRRIRDRVPSRLVMIGDGPDRFAVERDAESTGLADVVDFVGEQHDLVPWLSSADLFLLPSAQESFGLAALEAMSCGVPVVASRVGGLPEVIEDGITGFVCDPSDLGAMVDRGVALLTDRALHGRIATAAISLVRDRFSTERIVPQYEAYYEHVLSR
jgi:N-acetyl-alpha-D-glucosaminyl L-malate synthase BshA